MLICGPSGSGKTTFLQQLKQEIRPAGMMEGEILFYNQELEKLPAKVAAKEIGFVFQDPDNQLVLDSAEQELAFALENMGYTEQEMRKRIGEMAHFFGIHHWLDQPIEKLSGGQKQLINLASVLLLRPKLLLLDEPTAQLDPVAAKEFLQLIGRINEEFSTTIMINEHRIEELFPMASQVLFMEEGKIAYQGSPRSVCQQVWNKNDKQWFPYLPALSQLYLASQATEVNQLKHEEQVPLTVKEGKKWLKAQPVPLKQMSTIAKDKVKNSRDEIILACQTVSFRYQRKERNILSQLDCQVKTGEIYSILGGNGSGKTTLLKIMLGLIKPQQGKVLYKNKPISKLREQERYRYLGYVDQHPRLYFIYDTLEACLLKRAHQLQLDNPEKEIERLFIRLGIDKNCLTRHPYDLSGGEQQKAALAMVLLAKPELLLLDEPTKGIDPETKQELGRLLREWVEEGLTVIMVSHDLEFVAEYADRCTLLFDGQLSRAVCPAEFFGDNYFYTTVIQRVFREWFPTALTARDVIEQWPVCRNGSI